MLNFASVRHVRSAILAVLVVVAGLPLVAGAAGAPSPERAKTRRKPAASESQPKTPPVEAAAPADSTAKQDSPAAEDEEEEEVDYDQPLYKTDAEWKKLLTRKQYRVARLGETEPAYRGKYWRTKLDGTYHCVCCDAPLFSSDAKFDSGTGWPSFWAPVNEKRLGGRPDFTGGSLRIEVLCTRCDAHLGHVFDDGPAPTGLRYCINSAALELKQSDDAKSSKAER